MIANTLVFVVIVVVFDQGHAHVTHLLTLDAEVLLYTLPSRGPCTGKENRFPGPQPIIVALTKDKRTGHTLYHRVTCSSLSNWI